MTAIRCLTDSPSLVGEGPLWHPEERCLYWTDINGMSVNRLVEGERRVDTWRFDGPVSAVCLTRTENRLLVACGMQVLRWNPRTDERQVLVEFAEEPTGNRLNDAGVGPDGSLWVGTMRNNVGADGSHLELDWDAAENRAGSLYCVRPDGDTLWRAGGLAIPNTMAWSPDGGTLYTGDSIDNAIRAYACEGAALGAPRMLFAGFGRGVPDGSAVDAAGYLWNCRYFGGCIVRVSPAGEVDRVVEMPVTNITNCVFGGDGLDTLYVTTASVGTPAGESLAGAVFAFEPGVVGVAPYRFG